MAIKHHKTHKNQHITFNNHLYLVDIYLDDSPFKAIKKSTQCGVSEYAVIYTIDKVIDGRSVFYVLPTDPIKNRFVQNRVDRSILFTKYYQQLLGESPSQRKSAESVSLKHISKGVVAYAGSNSPAPFIEFPADDYVVDELDECDSSNIIMGEERLSHSEDKSELYIGNPTVIGIGIDDTFNSTDMKEWCIPCSNCGHHIFPDFFKHVVNEIGNNEYILLDEEWDENLSRDIFIYCDKCGKPFNRFVDGEWVKFNNSLKSGYHISKLFSTNVTIAEIVEKFKRGLVNDEVLQRFYNGDLGLAYTAPGAKITSDLINSCKKNYNMPLYGNSEGLKDKVVVMGVDVGVKLHIRINEITQDGQIVARYIGSVNDFDDIKNLYYEFHVKCGVVDAQPETRLSKRMVASFKMMFMCYYGVVKRELVDPRYKIVTVDRTMLLDSVKEMFLYKTIQLPQNINTIPEYCDHLQALTRLYDENKETYKWVQSGPDHFFHAEAYALLAKRLFSMIISRGK